MESTTAFILFGEIIRILIIVLKTGSSSIWDDYLCNFTAKRDSTSHINLFPSAGSCFTFSKRCSEIKSTPSAMLSIFIRAITDIKAYIVTEHPKSPGSFLKQRGRETKSTDNYWMAEDMEWLRNNYRWHINCCVISDRHFQLEQVSSCGAWQIIFEWKLKPEG